VNLEKDQQRERALLLEKKALCQLSRRDVDRLMYLNLMLDGEYDEIDNYTKFLAPEERSQVGNKSQVNLQ
jgi:hypothetical protein